VLHHFREPDSMRRPRPRLIILDWPPPVGLAFVARIAVRPI
jgi:hypothetical protein